MRFALIYVWEIFTGVRDISDIVRYSGIPSKFKKAAALSFKLIRLLIIFALIFGSYRAIYFYHENFIKEREHDNLKIKASKNKSQELKAHAEKILKFKAESYILADDIDSMGANLFPSLSAEAEAENNFDVNNNLPEISVKAKILSNNKAKSVIILSVNKNNFRLRAGDNFMIDGRPGKIISINKEYVLINFDGLEIKIK
ncbi:MAG: hypothetical protein II948_09085 [Synergistaceae bacterium]|nr:hypothetical protein [Synergistaceae bacterium]MBQ4419365.1 hypothetical protein [Synergistaceae bacterium]MBQ9581498.1 hypothetical protein [Synergistaceae bacterium]MBQ9897412.1 hypothetical protein [Synergistaceae bacterium]MBR0097013.1 hypothetical protein [Synergistaceae bacterium]